MPIDGNVLLADLSGRPAVRPGSIRKRAMELRSMGRQDEAEQLQLEHARLQAAEQKRTTAEAEQIRGIYKTYDPARPEDTYNALTRINPAVAAKVREQAQELHNKAIDGRLKELDVSKQKLGLAGQIMGTINSPETYVTGVGSALSHGLIRQDEAMQLLQQGYTPQTQAWIQQQSQQALSAEQQLTQKYKALEERRAQGKYDAEMPGVAADSRLKQLTAEGNKPVQPVEKMTLAQQQAELNSRERQGDLNRGVQVRGQNISAAESRADRDLKRETTGAAKSEKYKQGNTAIQGIVDTLKPYEELVKKDPTWVVPGSKESADLNTLHTDLILKLKDAYSLGAITGPDKELLERILQDPTSAKGRFMGPKSLLTQIGQIKKIITNQRKSLDSNYNVSDRGDPFTAADNGLTVTDPAGGKHTFSSRAAAQAYQKAISGK